MRARPMLAVADVERASAWFQSVLGLVSGHGGTEYEMLLAGDELVLQLHEWDVHEHRHLGDPADSSRGNGAVIWFASDDLSGVVDRATAADVLEGPVFNPLAHHHELWLRSPDGYVVVVSGALPD